MGTRCAVASCSNSLKKTRERNLPVSYHSFPKDNEKLCKQWVNACYRKDQWNPKTSVICSIHFKEEDFELNLRSKLMQIKTKARLKAGVFPTLHLKRPYEPEPLTPRSVRMERKKRKILVETLLMEDVENNLVENEPPDEIIRPSTCSETFSPYISPEIDTKKYNNLLKKHNFLRSKYNQLLEQFNEKEKKLKQMEGQLSNLQQVHGNNLELENAINSLLSPAQRDLIVNRKKKVIWRTDDISKAFALRYLTRRCYTYLRNELKYPLPHISSLRRWAAKLNMSQGILHDVLRIMKVAAMNKTSLDLVTVLQFDEVKV